MRRKRTVRLVRRKRMDAPGGGADRSGRVCMRFISIPLLGVMHFRTRKTKRPGRLSPPGPLVRAGSIAASDERPRRDQGRRRPRCSRDSNNRSRSRTSCVSLCLGSVGVSIRSSTIDTARLCLLSPQVMHTLCRTRDPPRWSIDRAGPGWQNDLTMRGTYATGCCCTEARVISRRHGRAALVAD